MRALDRVTAVLEAVAASPAGLSVTELAEQAELSLPTVSRIARDLADSGLLSRLGDSGPFRLGPKLIAMAYSPGAHSSLLDLITPVLHDLRDKTEETTSVHVPLGDKRVCLRDVPGIHQVRRVIPPGLTLPLHVGATGLTLLAYLPASDRERYLSALPKAQHEDLRSRVDAVREVGWALADSELSDGIAGMAAPILSHGRAVAVISISGPSFRLTAERMKGFGSELLRTAKQVSDSLSLDQPSSNGIAASAT